MANNNPNVLIGANSLYVASSTIGLLSINLADGSQNWIFTRSGFVGGPYLLLPDERTLVVFGDALYVVSSAGDEIASIPVPFRCDAIYCGNVIIVVTWFELNTTVTGYSSDFQQLWQTFIPASAGCSQGDTTLLSTDDNTLLYVHCRNIGTSILAQTGSIKSTLIYPEPMRNRAIITRNGQYGYLQTQNGLTSKYDLSSGAPLWGCYDCNIAALSDDESIFYMEQYRNGRFFVDGLSALNGEKVFTSHVCSRGDPFQYSVILGRNNVLALGSQCGISTETGELIWRGQMDSIKFNGGGSLSIDAQGNLYGAWRPDSGQSTLIGF